MTIAAIYVCSEGVVFGADSTTTFTLPNDSRPVQLLDHAQKVFEVGEQSRFGLCTWGAGNIAGVSHRTVVARLAQRLDKQTATVEDAVRELRNVVYQAAEGVQFSPAFRLGYFVGGHDPDYTPRCCRVGFGVFEGQLAASEQWLGPADAFFEGAPEYFNRVFKGFSIDLPPLLMHELAQRVPNLPSNFEQLFGESFDAAARRVTSIGHVDLPLREAIDYVHTYLYVTIKAFKFRYGPRPCGGPIEIGYISTDRPFRWACHKPFNSAVEEHLHHAQIP